jgi:hypothetical protein
MDGGGILLLDSRRAREDLDQGLPDPIVIGLQARLDVRGFIRYHNRLPRSGPPRDNSQVEWLVTQVGSTMMAAVIRSQMAAFSTPAVQQAVVDVCRSQRCSRPDATGEYPAW